jgi:hypothetical protein
MRYLLLLALAGTACGGGKTPETSANPARGLRDLSKDDAEVFSIAVAATHAVGSRTGSGTTFFSGVFVNGRKARLASDAVARATGFTPTSSTRAPRVECRAVNTSTGQSRAVPCPATATQSIPPTVTFDEIRATADSAYVGITEEAQMSSKGSCATLVRRNGAWTFLSTTVMADPRQCGK